MQDRTGAFRRIVRHLQERHLPSVPFAPDQHGKGLWEHVTRAQPHAWRHYSVEGDVSAPIRCIVLSDLHMGSHGGDLARLEAIAAEIMARRFDLLLLPGDFVNMQVFGGGRIRPEATAEVLAPLARAMPAVAVLGNHDAEYGVQRVAAALEGQRISVLFNQRKTVETAAGALDIVGLEDHRTGRRDAGRALAALDRPGRTLVLAHDPASFAEVPAGPIATVCGHTHGGQIRLPLLGAVVNASSAPLSWTHGHILDGGRSLIVSAGLGTSTLPLRFNCPPEIVEITIAPRERPQEVGAR
jgi:predicted MPP superfamily phosphohydrolase